MPITIPSIDDRRYEDLRAEALARIPVHTPEWTNFNRGDPGVTLIELFAFLTEAILYRANQIPERNRRKFLQLLRIPLNSAVPARGMVSFANLRGPRETLTLAHGADVRADAVPFRTEQGLDVLPVESAMFYKRALTEKELAAHPELIAHYGDLYASYRGQPPQQDLKLYESMPFPAPDGAAANIADAIDRSLWIALLTRHADGSGADVRQRARESLANKTLSFGVMPELPTDTSKVLSAHRSSTADAERALAFSVPNVPAGGELPADDALRDASYRSLDAIAGVDVLTEPGVIQVTLPGADQLGLWTNLDPLEPGSRDFPPAVEDTRLAERVITWVRVRVPEGSRAQLRWAGINCAMVMQRQVVVREALPNGTGEPDQEVTLAQRPVVAGSVRLRTRISFNGSAPRTDEWKLIDDLQSAAPEVPRLDPQAPMAELAGDRARLEDAARVFVVDEEAGRIRFGDGAHGARPPADAKIEVDYDVTTGLEGNVGAASINTGPTLPPGVTVNNPVATWGGADAEAIGDAEKQIPLYLQHRDRLVTIADYETIVRRTPGLEIARVEALAAFNPELPNSSPGDAPGAITVMIIPRTDPVTPDAPQPDGLFLNTVCRYVDSRRLVTTEVFLRGPKYKGIWVSVGITVKAGESVAEVRERVKRRLRRFLSPLPSSFLPALETGAAATDEQGWPLGTPVVTLELLAEASREPAVQRINGVRLADAAGIGQTEIKMEGLELPRLLGITVTIGDPQEIVTTVPGSAGPSGRFVPVPVAPGEC
jgi:hypothetical protein